MLARLLAAIALTSSLACAQRTDLGAWFAFAGQGSLPSSLDAPRLRWWFDGHLRYFEESNGFATSIFRPGIGYRLGDHTTVWVGYAWIRNDPVSGAFDEHRAWQQLTWSKSYDWGTPFLRTRLEQRFDERGDDTGLRLRQFVRWTYPLVRDESLGVRVWDEVFVDLNDTDWGQDIGLRQNRAFAGLGWTLDERRRHTLEFGYLNQHLFRDGADDDSNHILSITLLSNF